MIHTAPLEVFRGGRTRTFQANGILIDFCIAESEAGEEKMNKSDRVRVLYSQGCPNLSPTIDLIRRVANDIGAVVTVEPVLVASPEDAVKLRCLGSPTVQINGLDIEPAARDSVSFGLG
jgi:hypothetical protein